MCRKNTIAHTHTHSWMHSKEIIGSSLYRCIQLQSYVIYTAQGPVLNYILPASKIPHFSEGRKRQIGKGLWTAACYLSALISFLCRICFYWRHCYRREVAGNQQNKARGESMVASSIAGGRKIRWVTQGGGDLKDLNPTDTKYLNYMKTDKANYTVHSAMHKTMRCALSPQCANSFGSPLW